MPVKLANLNIENKNNDSLLSNVISISSSCTEEQNQRKIILNTHEASKEITSSDEPSESVLTNHTMHYERNMFTNITLPAKRKVHTNTDQNAGSIIKQKPTTLISSRMQQTEV